MFCFKSIREGANCFKNQENVINLCYKKLGNHRHQGLWELKSKKIKNDLSKLDDHISNRKTCQFKKEIMKPFSKTTQRAT